ncbi:response regulator [Noviherbaspirillum soli]|uniref:response regulator n=1 Tax=Noviherbaspirillum soli TaxID=1064518 RepID=UPI00188C598D|nr:response regulator transcription factor [Noviherbaspirillum soli]
MMSQAAARQPINVMIVEDDNVTRKYLAAAIKSEPALQLVAAFDSVQPALAWLVSTPVDLLLTDLGLPDGSGVDVIRACVDRWPNCGILVITMSSDEDSVLACIEAGAAGYVLKDAGRLDIVRALLDLHSGGSPISPLIARKVLGRMRDAMPASSSPPGNAHAPSLLTRREAAILNLIARGDSYGEVARTLSVSVGTVQTHVKNIYGKLSVHSRGEAVFEAQRRGLLHMATLKAREPG